MVETLGPAAPEHSLEEEQQVGFTESRKLAAVLWGWGRALAPWLHVDPADPRMLPEANLSLCSQHGAQGRRVTKLQEISNKGVNRHWPDSTWGL